MNMQFRAICSEVLPATKGSRIYRALPTVLTSDHPQYTLVNLIAPPHELEQGMTYRITIEKQG
jgi:hypothetical protein